MGWVEVCDKGEVGWRCVTREREERRGGWRNKQGDVGGYGGGIVDRRAKEG